LIPLGIMKEAPTGEYQEDFSLVHSMGSSTIALAPPQLEK
jgi:hypothetical protein